MNLLVRAQSVLLFVVVVCLFRCFAAHLYALNRNTQNS